MSTPLHIRCGEDIFTDLESAGIPGERLSWCDPLSIGPTPRTSGADDWYRLRAEYLAAAFEQTPAVIEQDLRGQDQRLSGFRQYSPVVLWFEHDLFDQAILIRLLDWFSRQDLSGTGLRLICIDRFPSISRFVGLGQLTARQLASLYPAAQPVSEAQFAFARFAWQAWTSPSPAELVRLSRSQDDALPFAAHAAQRKLQEFPSLRNGLSRTEQTILELVRSGLRDREKIFLEFQNREEAPWMGDSMLFAELDRLASLPVPLLVPAGGLTSAGELVLTGELDAFECNPVDRWVAGVRLRGRPAWRWDTEARELIETETGNGR